MKDYLFVDPVTGEEYISSPEVSVSMELYGILWISLLVPVLMSFGFIVSM